MRKPTFILLFLSLTSSLAAGSHLGKINNLVTFGDSYTDIVSVGDGGTAWPVYVAGYANISLFPFAKSGATCSNKLTLRPFPSIFESQLPAYFAELSNGSLSLDPKDTIYTLWIGTNDVGANALLTGDPGSANASIVDVEECATNWVKVLYDSGARNFLFQNMIPLNLVPMYSVNAYPNQFWHAEFNATEWSVFMRELVLSGNALSKAFLKAMVPSLPSAHVGLFDSHALFADIYNNPAAHLNGTAPLNVTEPAHSCIFHTSSDAPPVCTIAQGTDRDSFLWWDELHPSEQADRIVARNIADVIEGKTNKWTTWFS